MIMVKEFLSKPILIEDLGMMFPRENSKQKRRYGIYKCGFCRTEFKASTYDIKSGNTNSCGCYKIQRVREGKTKHGLIDTRLYKTWINIKGRVLNPNYKQYIDYGARGITICDEWEDDFMPFYDWAMLNGYSDELSIDRIDNDGSYYPENCRWTTPSIQTRNQRVYKNNTSGYKGIHFDKKLGKYRAKICVNKKRIHLGYFLTKEEGAIAYNNYIIENNLEGFILNEIPDKKEIKEK